MGLHIKNENIDFFIKSLLVFLTLPIGSAWAFMISLAKIGGSAWDYDGLFGYYVLGMLGGYIFYSLGLLLSIILIAIFNKKYMSGEGIKFWTKVGLLSLALLSNWGVLYLISRFFL